MVWEAVFLLVVLKIPIVYLCAVVWIAVRAEPDPDEPAVAARLVPPASPLPAARRSVWRPRRRRAGGPSRRPAPSRGAVARAEARR